MRNGVDLPDWASTATDVTVPNAARVYDYMLGGAHNFAADREFAEEVERVAPDANVYISANRAFVGRAVRWLVGQRIRQFLDIGSGIPTVGNVHEIAQSATPEARVVYIDIDPVAVAHGEALLACDPRTSVFQADLARPNQVLSHPGVLELLDFTQPMAVLVNAVMHFLPDTNDPQWILAQIRDAVVQGSYITLTHAHHRSIQQADLLDQENRACQLYQRTATALCLRTREQVRDLLTGWDIVEPGFVPVADWNPEPDSFRPSTPGMLAAVGRKP
jgi:hypothetical protein